ncbi:MAG: shikimate dehydrogenase [Nocardioides sp.]|uniref:shikimate dehydrogenase n=1 Tax=Nocardioides sp. TaxID=35761 RepID=UPI003D6BD665
MRHHIGLIGSGISTSLSPALHTQEAVALGLDDYRYALVDLEPTGRSPEETPDVLREAVGLGYTGFNITYPCKQAVLPALDELSQAARLLGAVNTVQVTEGGLIGHNTDHSGFLSAFRRVLRGAALGTVAQTGAGGAGTAVAHALAESGVRRLVLADPDPVRAEEVAARISRAHPGCTVEPVGAVEQLADCDGLVNASPVGMEGHPGTPIEVSALHPGLWVADIVYRPAPTALLAAAERLGCRTLSGLHMLVDQAADTFRILTGTTPDRDRMRAHLESLLADRQMVS